VFLWFPWGRIPNSYGPEPLAGTLILGYLVARSLRELRHHNHVTVRQTELSVGPLGVS
jgi:hypothetical protein